MNKHRQYGPYIAVGVTAFAVIAAALLLFFTLFHLSALRAFLRTLAHILRPIFLGMIFAFLLLPVHRGIFGFLVAMTPEKRLKNKGDVQFLNVLAIILSLLLAVFLLYLLLAMALPQVYLSIVGLVNAFPDYINSVQEWLQKFLADNPDIQNTVMSVYVSAAASLEDWLNADILPNLTGVMSSVSALVVSLALLLKDLLIALIVTFYLLIRKDVFAAQSKKIVYSMLPTHVGDLVVEETRSAYRIMSGFINGKLLDSLIIGVIALVCCNLLKFPYPALLATIIGVTNVIPFFGPFIGAIPCGLLVFLDSPIKCVYFAIFILVLQQFDGNILGPKILGDSTGLASFWVLFSILLFGGLFGFAGMVLGVPVFAMIYSVLRRLVHYGLRRRGLPEDTKFYLGKTGPMGT